MQVVFEDGTQVFMWLFSPEDMVYFVRSVSDLVDDPRIEFSLDAAVALMEHVGTLAAGQQEYEPLDFVKLLTVRR